MGDDDVGQVVGGQTQPLNVAQERLLPARQAGIHQGRWAAQQLIGIGASHAWCEVHMLSSSSSRSRPTNMAITTEYG